jgi:hypothetical protein
MKTMVEKSRRKPAGGNRRPFLALAFLGCLMLLFSVFLSANTYAEYPDVPYSLEDCDNRFTQFADGTECTSRADVDQGDVNDIANDLDESGDDTPDDLSTECLFINETSDEGGVGSSEQNNWSFLCAAVPFFSQSIDWLNTQVANQVGFNTVAEGSDDDRSSPNQFIDTDQIYSVWTQTVLPIANILLAMVFLVIIYGVATGGSDGRGFISAYNIKKILPRIIIAAILINVSYYVCMVFNDLVNIIAAGISNLFSNGVLKGDVTGWGLGGMMQAIGDHVLDGEISMGLGESSPLAPENNVVAVLYCILGIPTLLASLGIFLLLALRELIVVILILASPIIFAVSLLPSWGNLSSKYISMFIKLLLIYPAIVAVVMLCFQIEVSAYIAFDDGESYSLLPIILISVVSLVPFITIKPFYKAFTSLFDRISNRAGDIQTRVSTASRPKTPDSKGRNWLTNTQQRLKAALTNQSNTTSRQHSIKEQLERETLEKTRVKEGGSKSTKTSSRSDSSTSVRGGNIVNNDRGAEITNAINNRVDNITRARSERTQKSFLSSSTNQISNNPNLDKLPSLPTLPNQRLEQSRRSQVNPALTLDRMDSRLKFNADRAGGTSSTVPNNTVNNFGAQPKAPDKGQIAPDVSRRKAAEGEKKQPLTATLNAPKFADVSKTTAQPQKDQIEANLSEKAEKLLTQNRAATADKTKDTDKETGKQITKTLDALTKDVKVTDDNIAPDVIETAMNGGVITADAKADPKLDDGPEDGLDDSPLAPSILPPETEPPSTAKNIRKTLKNIFS